MKILYTTTIGNMMGFFIPFIRKLVNEGHTVDIATNENNGITSVSSVYRELGCRVFNISCSRSPIDRGNIKAIYEIKQLVESNHYDIVHCHSPIAAACTRLACRKLRKNGVRVFYTAHGFHFYDGAPLKYWLCYYPIEWICSWWTDTLITINQEDYKRAQEHFHAIQTVYVSGVGVDTEVFSNPRYDKNAARNRAIKRKEIGIPNDAKLIISVGELCKRKNHKVVINAIANMEDKPYYIIVGRGTLREELQKQIDELFLSDQVILLGHRKDISELLATADYFVLPSLQEGLPVALMEAMAAGLPIACSRIRGNTDLIDDMGGYLFDPHNIEDVKNAIEKLMVNCENMGTYNQKKIQAFDIQVILEKMSALYDSY